MFKKKKVQEGAFVSQAACRGTHYFQDALWKRSHKYPDEYLKGIFNILLLFFLNIWLLRFYSRCIALFCCPSAPIQEIIRLLNSFNPTEGGCEIIIWNEIVNEEHSFHLERYLNTKVLVELKNIYLPKILYLKKCVLCCEVLWYQQNLSHPFWEPLSFMYRKWL